MYKRLKGLMAENNLNQDAMAKKLGLSYAAFNRKFNGKDEFRMSEILKIMEMFDKTFEEIFLCK